jgi:hypothetical protein
MRQRVPQLDLLRGTVGLVSLCLALRVARHPYESEQVQYAFHLRADTLFAAIRCTLLDAANRSLLSSGLYCLHAL